ncbi:MAG: RluA family pseudouridine synthase [Chloracidobacterium sp.]|nr:RluA family pseudouridine synthase [Chloracidobacterium sp.]
METRFEIVVTPGEHKMRLEDLLFERFRSLSKIYLRGRIRDEMCEVNGRWENRGHRLRANDFVEITLDPTRMNSMVPEAIPLQIVFEDDHIVVVNKPAGMLVHPSHRDKNGTLLNALAHHLNRGDGPHVRPGLVHRLDKDTSGLLLIAKNTRAHGRLARQFEKKTVEKRYVALVEGDVEQDEGTMDAPIGRFIEEKRWDVMTEGRAALTRFRVLEKAGGCSLLELEPVTGRTNQLRIHCAAIGHPIVGDTERGGRVFSRLCLQAFQLSFRHPGSNEMVSFKLEHEFELDEILRTA